MHVTRPIQVWRARRGAGCVVRPQKVWLTLVWCGALAQSKYLSRHDSALKVLFYEMLHDLELIDEVPPWYSPAKPKPVYESDDVQAYWDVPVFADHEEVRCNRVSTRPQDQAGRYPRNELSVGQQQREEERREDHKVCPPTLGIETAVPWLRSKTTQHHH